MAQNARKDTHIIIIGAGIVGLASAIGFRNADFQVTILERATEFPKHSAGIAVPPNATNALRVLGVIDEAEALTTQPAHFNMLSYRDGTILSHDEYSKMRETYNTTYLNAHRATFHRILLDKATHLGTKIVTGVEVREIDFSAPAVYLTNGDVYNGDLVLGADGQVSMSRQLMLGRDEKPIHAGDAIWALDIKQTEMWKYPELRKFIDPPCVNIWFGPQAHAVVFGLKEDGLVHVVGSVWEDPKGPVRARPYAVDLPELRERFKDWDPQLRQIFDMPQEGLKWTLTATPDLTQWVHREGKFSVIGDAAHAMLPFFAQGAAQGVEDATVLTQLFARLTHKDQIPDLLTIFADLRTSRALRMKHKANESRLIYTMPDGEQQRERDRQITEHADAPFDGYPLAHLDPGFNEWIYRYDIPQEVDKAWKKWAKGQWPRTRGSWKTLGPKAVTNGI
ncbi:MAG: hypothetical protein M1821_007446 [Bathelium mastoideum]|nr:MAG: hypothetical protein M1821_007446 [Bathelium mastoideum]